MVGGGTLFVAREPVADLVRLDGVLRARLGVPVKVTLLLTVSAPTSTPAVLPVRVTPPVIVLPLHPVA